LFKKQFQYFKSVRVNFPLLTQVLLVYALTAMYNFLNMHDLDDLNDYSIIEDEVIDKEDTQMVEEESDIGIN
jgi:hypothetical protein